MEKKANESKLVHATFTTSRETCPPPFFHINNVNLPQQEYVKHLLHLNRRVTWRKHLFTKQKKLGMMLTKLYWLLGPKSKFSTSREIVIYKAILWTYGTQLWGTASTSNTDIIECFQSKVLCMIVDSTLHMLNTVMKMDFQTPTVKE
jgi:hypothetical protein